MATIKKNRKKQVSSDLFQSKSEKFEDKIYFKDPKKISEHLICQICQDVFNDPWCLSCGHTFCRTCVTTWLASNKSCPTDRTKVTLCCKNFALANIIGDLEISCSWRPYGCGYIGRYYIVKDHIVKCKFNPNKMDPVMQEKMRHINVDTPPTPAKKTKQSSSGALDELMSQLDDSIVEDDLTSLPQLEEPSLAARLYMINETKDTLVRFLSDKPVFPS